MAVTITVDLGSFFLGGQTTTTNAFDHCRISRCCASNGSILMTGAHQSGPVEFVDSQFFQNFASADMPSASGGIDNTGGGIRTVGLSKLNLKLVGCKFWSYYSAGGGSCVFYNSADASQTEIVLNMASAHPQLCDNTDFFIL